MDFSRDHISLTFIKREGRIGIMEFLLLGVNIKGKKWVEWNVGVHPMPTFVLHPKVGGMLHFPY